MNVSIMTAILIIAGTGVIAGVGLVLAAKFMYVYEDPRVGEVNECLPGANCGACGYAGCADYAKAIVENDEEINLCTPGGPSTITAVGKVMGKVASALGSKKAVVACQGFDFNTTTKFEYQGIKTCSAASKIYAGPGACSYGCLGFGDCVVSCKFDAIKVVNGVAVVLHEKCTGCGACAKVCPKFIIEIMPDDINPTVLCKNCDKGAVTRKVCKTGCISCTRCARVCPTNAITIENNIAYITPELCISCMQCESECPTKAIQVANFR